MKLKHRRDACWHRCNISSFQRTRDIHQRCLDCFKTYSSISAYITHLHYDHTDMMLYVSAEHLPDYGVAIEHNSILRPFGHELHRDQVLHSVDDDSSETEADRNTSCINPDYHPVRTHIYGTLHLVHSLAGKPISIKYFDICHNGIDPLALFPSQEEYRFGHWCVKYN